MTDASNNLTIVNEPTFDEIDTMQTLWRRIEKFRPIDRRNAALLFDDMAGHLAGLIDDELHAGLRRCADWLEARADQDTKAAELEREKRERAKGDAAT